MLQQKNVKLLLLTYLLVFKQVPSEICENCGEEYISSEVNKSLLRHAREELNRNVSLEMLDFSPRASMKSA
ncbi:MAG: YgiT-type zinc finger protein [Candidatus Electrothrix sp. MAN1_4]|nr:YgiT-type zinc finger protein [Candidatus Electrothrix sp. MAN1_4]